MKFSPQLDEGVASDQLNQKALQFCRPSESGTCPSNSVIFKFISWGMQACFRFEYLLVWRMAQKVHDGTGH